MSYSFLDLAYEVLKSATQPLVYQEIWQIGEQHGLTRKFVDRGENSVAKPRSPIVCRSSR